MCVNIQVFLLNTSDVIKNALVKLLSTLFQSYITLDYYYYYYYRPLMTLSAALDTCGCKCKVDVML